MAAATAHFKEEGYLLDAPDPGKPRSAATTSSSWRMGVGTKDKQSMYITVDPGCVSTSHDPKTQSPA